MATSFLIRQKVALFADNLYIWWTNEKARYSMTKVDDLIKLEYTVSRNTNRHSVRFYWTFQLLSWHWLLDGERNDIQEIVKRRRAMTASGDGYTVNFWVEVTMLSFILRPYSRHQKSLPYPKLTECHWILGFPINDALFQTQILRFLYPIAD